jgi:hypothetical protein
VRVSASVGGAGECERGVWVRGDGGAGCGGEEDEGEGVVNMRWAIDLISVSDNFNSSTLLKIPTYK